MESQRELEIIVTTVVASQFKLALCLNQLGETN